MWSDGDASVDISVKKCGGRFGFGLSSGSLDYRGKADGRYSFLSALEFKRIRFFKYNKAKARI